MSNEVDQAVCGAMGLSKRPGVDFDELITLFKNDPEAFWSKRNEITYQALPDGGLPNKHTELQFQIDELCQKATDPFANLSELTGRLIENLEYLGAAMTHCHAVAGADTAECLLRSNDYALVQKSERQLCELQQMVAAVHNLQKELQTTFPPHQISK